MSVNQSRGDKNEPPHYRRSANFSGGGGGGGGRGGGTTGPSSSAYYSGKSFKKVVSNAQGGYSNANLGPSSSSYGAHVQPPLRGTPDASSTGGVLKPADASVQKTTPGLPKAQPSNAVPLSSGTFGSGSSSTPVKGSADASRAFFLQFGSISPSVINGMQARIDSLKAASSQNSDVPKQHLPRKDPGPVEQPGEARLVSKEKKDALSSPSGPVAAHAQKVFQRLPKMYSRDFLLTFSDHCTDLPKGFKITHDITEVLVVTGVDMAREPYPSSGRGGGDRSVVGSRLNRQPSNVGLDDKWNRGSGGPMGPGWDSRLEMGYPSRGNHGVMRTPRSQPPVPQLQRNNSVSKRWQQATGYQKGLMSSPHTPMMHKAERKYEVGKVTDEEQAKQRRLKSILNKLTPQNFEKLFDQVKQVNIDNVNTLSGVIGQIFDKALMEPTFVEMYANFCSHLAVELPGFVDDNEKITFKRLLLNKCQEEFERGEREEEEANRTDVEGEIKQTEEEREEKRVKARRRMLGNIRFIGELYKKRMLTERIMHECIMKLLSYNQKNANPDEEDIEALCKLMSTIGEMIDHPKAKAHMDAYFDMMFQLSNNMALSSRVRFMLKDAIDLRKNKWQHRRKVEGPKKIEEVHRDAAQERQAQSSRLARGPNSNPSLRRGGQPMDFGPRGSAGVLSPNPQMGGGFRGYGGQDSRFDSFENRTLPVPLRPMGDEEAITLGPQGGLARGMSVRGQPTNGYGPSRDDLASRYTTERFSPRPTYDRPNIQQHNNMNHGNQDTRSIERGGFDRVLPPERARVSTSPQSDSSDKILSEDRLHDMSIEAIKEFYSARDEKEVALCIKDLNAPGFHPTMISVWVTDSFERKDMDRDLLAKLLVNLTKSQEGILTRESLVRGLELVLSTLEDAVNDAPKAAEFLGRMLARLLLENAIPYKEVWRLIYTGGEEQGRLVEMGLAAEVVGVVLEIIKSEKGDPFLNEVRAASNLRVEVFRSPKTSRLDKFI
ncbi:putative MIF4G-like, type 3, initiation factor eIF-4 gamma, MA3, MIF4G-like domain superfamily [Helianthus annuus]|nr:putative MIF4G-like, type 3, initiation factor eIF-4 gamma, MA3, MIF4G-like domain superfamily [Helianthus annuus]KAJ0461503.1 putative MIF4G-like, type 3, initiation factor eIF-4 gamma, MA3, MIF4G-like domain superfamily [Helianthus annuus]KAJ0645800.1 putative MIF4G-like, type 3, initiation factor eIF-4 gamma, MA3, MIF4G-like domain superfamily [Helianthus annuus]KAJ0822357.1 putative MIF4G-like, type 3, initiation factor eIF-4 gamma, MA3, MIF4G-like domain superfamily [Helianthus annuus]